MNPGFGIWITGLPASGKSSITRELLKLLDAEGVQTVALESDEMRKILTPAATYSPDERDRFYHMLILIGELITRRGVNVVFDATANKRAYRDEARAIIPRFVEVYVLCPLAVCRERDPKRIYLRATAGETLTVPGLQAPYEAPVHPEITVDGQASPERAAYLILDNLKRLMYI
jgi:adenylylsulfate kinase